MDIQEVIYYFTVSGENLVEKVKALLWVYLMLKGKGICHSGHEQETLTQGQQNAPGPQDSSSPIDQANRAWVWMDDTNSLLLCVFSKELRGNR